MDLPSPVSVSAVGGSYGTKRSVVAQARSGVAAGLHRTGGVRNRTAFRNSVPGSVYRLSIEVVEEIEHFAHQLQRGFFPDVDALGNSHIKVLHAREPERIASQDIDAEAAV